MAAGVVLVLRRVWLLKKRAVAAGVMFAHFIWPVCHRHVRGMLLMV